MAADAQLQASHGARLPCTGCSQRRMLAMELRMCPDSPCMLPPQLLQHAFRFLPATRYAHPPSAVPKLGCPLDTAARRQQAWLLSATSQQTRLDPHLWRHSSTPPSARLQSLAVPATLPCPQVGVGRLQSPARVPNQHPPPHRHARQVGRAALLCCCAGLCYAAVICTGHAGRHGHLVAAGAIHAMASFLHPPHRATLSTTMMSVYPGEASACSLHSHAGCRSERRGSWAAGGLHGLQPLP